MSKNILIAQVGNGKYFPIKYTKFTGCDKESGFYFADGGKDADASIETEFSFYAIYKKLLLSGQVNGLLLVGTKTSSWYGLCQYIERATSAAKAELVKSGVETSADLSGRSGKIQLSDFETEKVVNFRGDETTRFLNIGKPETLERMERFLEQCLEGTDVKIVIQEFGIVPEESKQNFHILQETLSQLIDAPDEPGEHDGEVHLYLDISNGFRTFPVYLFLWTNYMAQMRPNRKIQLIVYYGMFESRMRKADNGYLSGGGGSYVPMIRMDDATDIMQWTNAVAEFYSNGSVAQIKKLLGEGSLRLVKVPCEGKEIPLSELFERFDFAMNSNNLNLLQSTTSAIAGMENYLDGGRAEKMTSFAVHSADPVKADSDDDFPEYVRNLLVHISEDFRARFSVEENGMVKYGKLSVQVADWYLQQGRIGDAAAALQEGMITYVLERFPVECAKLIQKKDGASDLEADDLLGRLFDFKIRETIRKNVFDTRDMEGMEWLSEYKYISEYLRNPAVRLQYRASDEEEGFSMDEARKQVGALVEKMLGGRLDEPIRVRLNDLLQMEAYDIFISYRRNYREEGDGARIAQKLYTFLTNREYPGTERKFRVFWDSDALNQTVGEFTPKIKRAIRNSRFFLLILGPHVFDQPYTGSEEEVFYREIRTAREKYFEKETFEVCIDGYEPPADEQMENFPGEMKRLAGKFQWLGGRNDWKEEDFDAPYNLGEYLIAAITTLESRVEEG